MKCIIHYLLIVRIFQTLSIVVCQLLIHCMSNNMLKFQRTPSTLSSVDLSNEYNQVTHIIIDINALLASGQYYSERIVIRRRRQIKGYYAKVRLHSFMLV